MTTMFSYFNRAMVLVCAFLLSLCWSCASVPKEVVELSYTTGRDMASLQISYDNLIHEFYEQLRDRRIDYLENSWTPLFVQGWVRDGKLVEVARGELVWSEDAETFVPSVPNTAEADLLQTVTTWADEAVYQIQRKKDSLLRPLDEEEAQLRRDVKEAFSRIASANATITAHLNSLRKVQEVQDDALRALNIEDLRDKINDALVNASDRAEQGLAEIRKADRTVNKAHDLLYER